MTQHLTAEALRKDFLAVFGQEAEPNILFTRSYQL